VNLAIILETVIADINRLPHIFSFPEDRRIRDGSKPFVRREASNKVGFSHYPLRALSRASFVDVNDITNHRSLSSIRPIHDFYDDRRNFAQVRDRELAFGPDEVRVTTEESYEYDPEFYDAIAAQVFNERSRQSDTVTHPPTTPPLFRPPATTVTPRFATYTTETPPVTYRSFPLRPLPTVPPFKHPLPTVPPFIHPLPTVPPFIHPLPTSTTTVPSTTQSTSMTTVPTTTVTTTLPTTVTTVQSTTLPPTTAVLPPDPEPLTNTIEDTVSIDRYVVYLRSQTISQKNTFLLERKRLNYNSSYCRDVIFVLDNSGSTKFHFEPLKAIIGTLADIAFEDSMRKVGLVTFSSRLRQRVVFDWISTRERESRTDFHRRLNDLTFAGGITQLGAVLSMLQDRLFDEDIHRVGRPLDIVLFTDGYSFDDPSSPARNLRLSGHRIYVAALFTNYLRSELDSITGDPARVITDMDALDHLAHSLHTCF
ncbi:hypothetical protein PFISCL1PPCAC_25687, partial [Pristionchus fissidentatus]